jgi:phosphonate transport system substrate-binding protein
MRRLKVASCMAENSESLCSAVAGFIENRIRIPTEYVVGIPWQERERFFDCGEIQILWLCGLPYAHKTDQAESGLELLAVPVPRGERYQGWPVYFSDVVIRRDLPFRSFFDVRGASWAYNEPRSHAGFNVVRAYLAGFGQRDKFFGTVVESGAHSASVEMVLSGHVDGSAIDSTVLEWLTAKREGLADEIRALLLGLHTEPFGKVMLSRARIDRFVEADDRD